MAEICKNFFQFFVKWVISQQYLSQCQIKAQKEYSSVDFVLRVVPHSTFKQVLVYI